MSITVPTRRSVPWLLALAITLLAPAPAVLAGPDDQFPETPTLNNGQKWRVGYYEGGPYGNYRDTLLGTVRGLVELGWLNPGEPPAGDDPESTADVWSWLGEPGRSEYLEFVADGHYSSNWDDALRAQNRTALLERLSGADDIDLMLAMGTWAGRDIAAKDEHDTPSIVLSTSDAVKAGIVPSIEDSGRDHVHAHLDPNRYGRQIEAFHDTVGFHRLGIVYQDSVEGRSYSAIALVQQVAAERGFEVSRCMLRGNFGDEERAEPTVIGCFEQLAPYVDAVYVVSQTGLNERTIPQLVELVTEQHLPTFAQHGGDVKKGMLMSMSRANHNSIGLFHASTAAKIFNGASPRRLGQVFEEEMQIILNVETARAIGFTPSPRLLATANIIGEPEVTAAASVATDSTDQFTGWLPRRAGR